MVRLTELRGGEAQPGAAAAVGAAAGTAAANSADSVRLGPAALPALAAPAGESAAVVRSGTALMPCFLSPDASRAAPPPRPAPLPTLLTELPADVGALIWSQLESTELVRASAVCRAWQTALRRASFWTNIDLDGENGYPCTGWLSATSLTSLAARARGRLEHLCIKGMRIFDFDEHDEQLSLSLFPPDIREQYRASVRANVGKPDPVLFSTLLEVLRSNARALRSVDITRMFKGKISLARVERLLAAAPRLHTLVAGTLRLRGAEARRVRLEPAFKALRFNRLHLEYPSDWEAEAEAGAEEAALFSFWSTVEDLTDYEYFVSLHLERACLDSAAAQEALCAFAASVDGIELKLQLTNCRLDASFVPVLARLVRLRDEQPNILFIDNSERPVHLFAGAEAAELFLEALHSREQDSFHEPMLTLRGINLWAVAGAGIALLRGLAGCLHSLDLAANPVPPSSATVIGRLVADFLNASPKLVGLSLNGWGLGDEGLEAVVAAVATHPKLRWLHVHGNRMSRRFAAHEMQMAVRSCLTLEHLWASEDLDLGVVRHLRLHWDVMTMRVCSHPTLLSSPQEGYVDGRAAERERAKDETRSAAVAACAEE